MPSYSAPPGRHRAPERPTPTAPTTPHPSPQIGRRGVLGLLAAAGVGSLAALAESGAPAEASPISATTPDPAPGVSIVIDRSTGFPIADIRQSVG